VNETTLRDARKLGLLPSVTTINGMLSKAGLDTWKQQQVLLAALTLPRSEGESEQEWLSRVMQDSPRLLVVKLRNGELLSMRLLKRTLTKCICLKSRCIWMRLIVALKDAFGEQLWLSEKSFGHPLGFGGKCDLMANPVNGKGNFMVDFKTKDTNLDKVDVYFEHEMQLAAYREGLGVPSARCAIVFVNGTD
jgi:hypothetical protein